MRMRRRRKQKRAAKGERAGERQQFVGHKIVESGSGRMAGVKRDVDMKHRRGNQWQTDFQKN